MIILYIGLYIFHCKSLYIILKSLSPFPPSSQFTHKSFYFTNAGNKRSNRRNFLVALSKVTKEFFLYCKESVYSTLLIKINIYTYARDPIHPGLHKSRYYSSSSLLSRNIRALSFGENYSDQHTDILKMSYILNYPFLILFSFELLPYCSAVLSAKQLTQKAVYTTHLQLYCGRHNSKKTPRSSLSS